MRENGFSSGTKQRGLLKAEELGVFLTKNMLIIGEIVIDDSYDRSSAILDTWTGVVTIRVVFEFLPF